MSVAQVLTEARKLISQGWTQGEYKRVVDGVECWCISGAIHQAASYDKPSVLKFAALFRSLRADDFYLSLIEWNDAPGRTQEDVPALIDRAIAKEAKA
jgi:hypothetical protein